MTSCAPAARLPRQLVSAIALSALTALAGCAPAGDDDDDDDGGEGEGEGEGEECTVAPATDVGDETAPLAIAPPLCTDVSLADAADQDCFSFPGPAGTLTQILYDDGADPVEVDVYNGQYLSTEFTLTGHTVHGDGNDIRVCFVPDDGEDAVETRFSVRAPVTDNATPSDAGNGSLTYSFDAPGDEDCALLEIGPLSHVIVVGDGCQADDELDVTLIGDSFDFGFFAQASGQSCGLALMSGAGDSELCIRDYSSARTLGSITFDVSFLADDHGSGALPPTVVTLPATVTAETEIDSDTDCFMFTVATPTDIAFAVTGQASDADIDVSMTWDGGDVFGEVSGTATAVDGDALFCVQSFDGGAQLTITLSAQ